jgi:hypothetical protein
MSGSASAPRARSTPIARAGSSCASALSRTRCPTAPSRRASTRSADREVLDARGDGSWAPGGDDDCGGGRVTAVELQSARSGVGRCRSAARTVWDRDMGSADARVATRWAPGGQPTDHPHCLSHMRRCGAGGLLRGRDNGPRSGTTRAVCHAGPGVTGGARSGGMSHRAVALNGAGTPRRSTLLFVRRGTDGCRGLATAKQYGQPALVVGLQAARPRGSALPSLTIQGPRPPWRPNRT